VIFAGSELAWYRWPDWKKNVIAATETEFTTDMQVADVNGDGAIDIIVPEGKDGNVWWFENPRLKGDPAQTTGKRHLVGKVGSFVHDVEVGDVNGDGKLDILTRKRFTTLWLQQTTGSFTEVPIATAALSGEGSALADLNRDGRLDIVQEGYWLECPPDPIIPRCRFCDVVAQPAEDRLDRLDVEIEEQAHVMQRMIVRLAHELMPDERDIHPSWLHVPHPRRYLYLSDISTQIAALISAATVRGRPG
jgi:hypothetical protein